MREWWIRTALVLQAPRAVFVALRDDGAESASDRAEPVLAVVLLDGAAYALSTRTAAHLMDDSDYDVIVTAVWTFLAGGLYGCAGYWFFGAVLHKAATLLGSQGSFRRNRQILAFASVPVVLSLVLWPIKLAVWGSALFHRGGTDAGTAGQLLGYLWLGFVGWAAVLLVIGVRAVHGWTWGRAALAAAAPVATAVALSFL